MACRRAWPLALLSASSLLAACGGHATQSAPRLPKSDAAQLIALAQSVARDAGPNRCAARSEIDALSAKARALVAAGGVPPDCARRYSAGLPRSLATRPHVRLPPAPTPRGHGNPHKEKHDHGHHGGD